MTLNLPISTMAIEGLKVLQCWRITTHRTQNIASDTKDMHLWLLQSLTKTRKTIWEETISRLEETQHMLIKLLQANSIVHFQLSKDNKANLLWINNNFQSCVQVIGLLLQASFNSKEYCKDQVQQNSLLLPIWCNLNGFNRKLNLFENVEIS
jgi:hypothetical protein